MSIFTRFWRWFWGQPAPQEAVWSDEVESSPTTAAPDTATAAIVFDASSPTVSQPSAGVGFNDLPDGIEFVESGYSMYPRRWADQFKTKYVENPMAQYAVFRVKRRYMGRDSWPWFEKDREIVTARFDATLVAPNPQKLIWPQKPYETQRVFRNGEFVVRCWRRKGAPKLIRARVTVTPAKLVANETEIAKAMVGYKVRVPETAKNVPAATYKDGPSGEFDVAFTWPT